jgi:hypothetical protein
MVVGMAVLCKIYAAFAAWSVCVELTGVSSRAGRLQNLKVMVALLRGKAEIFRRGLATFQQRKNLVFGAKDRLRPDRFCR